LTAIDGDLRKRNKKSGLANYNQSGSVCCHRKAALTTNAGREFSSQEIACDNWCMGFVYSFTSMRCVDAFRVLNFLFLSFSWEEQSMNS
jgi:hypothetical protein